jgi:hypothetical protein
MERKACWKKGQRWIKEETSEAMKGLFWIIENSIV